MSGSPRPAWRRTPGWCAPGCRTRPGPGARQSTVWTVRARMGAIRVLGRQLARDGIEIVTLESTSVIRGANMKKLDIAQVVPWGTRL